MITRRQTLGLFGAAAATAILPSVKPARAAATEFRIGWQKNGVLALAKRRGALEKRLADQGITVSWSEFTSGPPLLEALGAGALDFGATGDVPPLFAQAAGGALYYVGIYRGSPAGSAILVRKDSPIKTLEDLKGRKVAFKRGSSAHNVTVKALRKAGLAPQDVQQIDLAPPDAAAAFKNGSIDAWSIWDPYLALAELKENARVIAFDKDVHKPNAFYIANTDFVEKYPSLVAKLNTTFASEGVWANGHHEDVAKAQADATGVDIEAVRRFVDRSNFRVVPLDAEVIASQQAVADRFAKLGLIPKPVNVSDIVWKWTPGS
jgi:sulfonate transport system substrate-binding protein